MHLFFISLVLFLSFSNHSLETQIPVSRLKSNSVGHRPLRGCCLSNHLKPIYTHIGAMGTADHLTLLRLFLSFFLSFSFLFPCYLLFFFSLFPLTFFPRGRCCTAGAPLLQRFFYEYLNLKTHLDLASVSLSLNRQNGEICHLNNSLHCYHF